MKESKLPQLTDSLKSVPDDQICEIEKARENGGLLSATPAYCSSQCLFVFSNVSESSENSQNS